MLYKIGIGMYKGKDKNCGLFESDLIHNELIKIDNAKDKLFILNGKMDSSSKIELKEKMQNYEKKNRIFILTDLALINKEIMIECGTLLHSSKLEYFADGWCDKSYYSYIPDLYYDNDRKRIEYKSNIIVFGGSFGGTMLSDETVKRYVFDKRRRINDNILFVHKSDSYDIRFSYEDYKNLLDMSKYILCVKRRLFKANKWVTPRLLDGISSYCFPLVDKDYDCEYDYPKSLLCNDYYDLKRIMDMDESDKMSVLLYLRERANENKKRFSELVSSL